jgi:hypothetical protein
MALHSRIFGVKRELACQERVSFGQVHTVRWAVYKVTCLSSCLILMFNLKFNLNLAKVDIRIWKGDKLPVIYILTFVVWLRETTNFLFGNSGQHIMVRDTYTPVWALFSRNLNFDLNGFPIFEMLRCFKRKSKF